MDLKQLTWSKVAMVVVMAIVPATLSYCQARQKASTETAQAAREADAGYKVLVEAVKHLEMTVAAQHEAIKLISSHMSIKVEWPQPAGAGSAAAAGSAAELPPLPAPPELPADNAAALRQQAPL